jgi:hypothetical protein
MNAPTTSQIEAALTQLLEDHSRQTGNGLAMLKAHYHSPGQTISAVQLAKAAGYDSYNQGNQQYGRFAHKLADLMRHVPALNAEGALRWTYALCTASPQKDLKGHFEWVLRPEVACALENLGLVQRIVSTDALDDLAGVSQGLDQLSAMMREAYTKARIGQGLFREKLIRYWGGCAITGLAQTDVLIASHIKPWRVCTVDEALNMVNGLLLTPDLDKAFDRGYISFDELGLIMWSPQLTGDVAEALGITPSQKLRKLTSYHQVFLAHHRQHVFRGKCL